MTTWRRGTAAVAWAAAALACATVGGGAGERPPLQGVRRVALVRWNEHPGVPRPKDALDALAEALPARGIAVRVVEVGPRSSGALGPVAALYRDAGSRVGYEAGDPRGDPVAPLGGDAARAVRALEVDAVVTYHRLGGAEVRPVLPPDALRDVGPLPPPPSASARLLGALAVVDAQGRAEAFEWGPSDVEDPGTLVNAAEAVDAAVRALTGAPAPEP